MRISDWSSDVCSSDLRAQVRETPSPTPPRKGEGLRDLRRLAQLRELPQHHLALQPRQMVDEEDALQMVVLVLDARRHQRSEEHTSELQSLMRISYAVFCLKKKKKNYHIPNNNYTTFIQPL